MIKDELPFAEDMPYWKTSQNSWDAWMDKTKVLIIRFGGAIIASAYSDDGLNAGLALAFKINGDTFRVIFPILPSKTSNDKAARIQAATLLHHDVKAKILMARVFGARKAFFEYLMLPSGKVTSEILLGDFVELPLLKSGIGRAQ